MLECVINVSEGRDERLIEEFAHAAGDYSLDVHRDVDHHRSVFTLAGPEDGLGEAVRALASAVVARLDLRAHEGAHPRIGVLDVVPWVCLSGWPVTNGPLSEAVDARDAFGRWAGEQLGLPCFCYGPERSLPDVRRKAWNGLYPQFGPDRPHHRAGAAAIGARPLLIAYNLWLATADASLARRVASEIRGPAVRTLGLAVSEEVQVSCNLIDPWALGPDAVFDAVASRADVARAELVGLLPQLVLERIARHRWKELDLDPSRTIEARLERAGLDGGRFAAQG